MIKSSKLIVGVDIVEIDRIKLAISSWQNSFLKRVYTDSEIKECKNLAPRLASRFAAKEALIKALGAETKGVSWRDIEITSNDSGAPLIQLYGKAQEKANDIGIRDFAISLSHTKNLAVAFVVGNVN